MHFLGDYNNLYLININNLTYFEMIFYIQKTILNQS